MATVADPQIQPARRAPRKKRRGLVVFLLLLGLLAAGILYPPTFLFAVRQLLGLEAWRCGLHLTVENMEGGAAGPILLYNTRLTHHSQAGTDTELKIDTARASFAWQHLFWRRNVGVWKELSLDGVQGSVDVPGTSDLPSAAAALLRTPSPNHLQMPVFPSALLVHHADLVVRQGGDFLRLAGVTIETSDVEPGTIQVRSVSIQQPWLHAKFDDCRGTLALQDSWLVLADMKLANALTITSVWANLPELLHGQLEMKFALAAFSGTIQGDLKSGGREEHLIFDGGGNFSSISVAQLGAFVGQTADGSIKQGTFTFHGSPRDLEKATFTTRFEAADFQWGARHWNSLVAGVTYVNRRLLVPQFELRQSHNLLSLKGDTGVPSDWSHWWKTDFNFQLAARIDSLSELSALLGPGFGDVYGKLTVDGSIRGENSSFNGELIASGSHLAFRTAPLDELQAAIKLQGNELQVTNAEFVHGDDFLRGHGVVNILGEKRYWGEVHASIADLSQYSAILQPPISPQAFGGGLTLNWSGDGTAGAHSGAFRVTLNHIRPLGDDKAWHPIDLTAEATYSPESIYFSRLMLSNGETTLTSQVVATPKALALESLKLQHGKSTWLYGGAQIPLDVWSVWQNPRSAIWWNSGTPIKIGLKMDGLSIADSLLLTGREFPYRAELTGTLDAAGTLKSCTSNGALSIRKADAVFSTGTMQGGSADILLTGSHALINSASVEWEGSLWTAQGMVTVNDLSTPVIDMTARNKQVLMLFALRAMGSAALNLHAAGPFSAMKLSGSGTLHDLLFIDAIPGTDEAMGLHGPPRPVIPLPSLIGPSQWKLDVAATGPTFVVWRNGMGWLSPKLHLGGTIGAPELSGNMGLADFVRENSKPPFPPVELQGLFSDFNSPLVPDSPLKPTAGAE